MNSARNIYWNRLIEYHAKILAVGLVVGYCCSAAHAQLLDEYSDNGLYRSPLKQALGQKHHARSSVDPYMVLIERNDPYYLLRSGTAHSALGAPNGLAGTALPDLAAGQGGLSSGLGLVGKSRLAGAGQFATIGGSSSPTARSRQGLGSSLAPPRPPRQPGQ